MRVMIPANVLALAEMNATLPSRPRRKVAAIKDADMKVVHEYSDGFKWALVTNEKAFINNIRNTMASGKILKEIKALLDKNYGLFDKDNQLLAIFIIKSGKIMIMNHIMAVGIKQISQKMYDKLRQYMQDFVNNKYGKYSGIQVNKKILTEGGWIISKNKLYDVRNLPSGLVLDTLDASYFSGKLPDKLTVKGYLNLEGWNITELPKGLKVGGGLNLADSKITKLPNGLTVNGDLTLNDTNITKLPSKLVVNGDLLLYGTKKLTTLPSDLVVEGDLRMSNSRVKEIPSTVKVDGSINIFDTSVKLPDNFVVLGNLQAGHLKIAKLPKNLTVEGSMDISHSSKITKLPENLEVGGDLMINATGIKQIPASLKVGGTLYMDKDLKGIEIPKGVAKRVSYNFAPTSKWF